MCIKAQVPKHFLKCRPKPHQRQWARAQLELVSSLGSLTPAAEQKPHLILLLKARVEMVLVSSLDSADPIYQAAGHKPRSHADIQYGLDFSPALHLEWSHTHY